MKLCFVKQAGGVLTPVDDREARRLDRVKTGTSVVIDIKTNRNGGFHRKAFAFFNFCFEHHDIDDSLKTEEAQFNGFRKDLTILAGYYDEYVRLNGDLRVEAKSLAFDQMEQEEFEQCYVALTNAAMKYIFKSADEGTYSRLISFF
jgi:hypothetical protein